MPEQYFEAQPGSAHDIRRLNLRFGDISLQADTDAGVFSRDGLDDGSALLLETTLPLLRGRVLDLGCGWGPIGLVIAKTCPECSLVMTDINARAADLARRNLALNGMRADVVSGDGFQAVEGLFEWILLNPPIRAGKDTVYRLFSQSAARLTDTGCLAVVIRKQQGALSAKAYLETLFHEVSLSARRKGYHIYLCRRARDEVRSGIL